MSSLGSTGLGLEKTIGWLICGISVNERELGETDTCVVELDVYNAVLIVQSRPCPPSMVMRIRPYGLWSGQDMGEAVMGIDAWRELGGPVGHSLARQVGVIQCGRVSL